MIASIQEDNPGPSTALEGQRGREDEEEEKDKEDTERQRGRGAGMKKREREDPFLSLLREDILYQRGRREESSRGPRKIRKVLCSLRAFCTEINNLIKMNLVL
ncbi:hypothetical protein F7725_015815, partial [Dissostichus mawsoni]